MNGAPPAAESGDDGDLARARRFRAALVLRAVVGLAAWILWAGARWWAAPLYASVPIWARILAPTDADIRADRRRARIDASTIGFHVLWTGCAAGLLGLTATVAALTAEQFDFAYGGVALMALAPIDYLLFRAGLSAIADRA